MNLVDQLTKRLDQYASQGPFTWVYGLGRSILALGTFFTLLLNSHNTLFDRALFGTTRTQAFIDNFNLFYLFGYDNLIWAKWLCIIILLLVMSGYLIKLTGILHWWVAFSFQHSASILDGGDQITMILTLLLIPITLLDDRKNHWYNTSKWNNPFANFTGNVIVEFLIPLQMAVIYLHAAVEKLYKVPEWRDGSAVYYFFKDNLFGYPAWMDPIFDFLFAYPLTMSAFTWGTIFLELVLFGGVFMAYKSRKWLLPLGIAFHLLIIFVFGLVSFFCAMTGGLVIYCIHKNQSFTWSKFPKWRRRSTLTTASLPT